MSLRTHSQTSGWSLTEQDPFNNVIRTCIEAMAAALGHTQSLHTNSLDEAIALPTDFSQPKKYTALFPTWTGITNVIDPWGGSYFVEYLTDSLIKKGWEHILEIKIAVWVRSLSSRNSKDEDWRSRNAWQQELIGTETIVGVNKFKLDKEDPIEILEVDNTAVRISQIKRLNQIKKSRDGKGC